MQSYGSDGMPGQQFRQFRVWFNHERMTDTDTIVALTLNESTTLLAAGPMMISDVESNYMDAKTALKTATDAVDNNQNLGGTVPGDLAEAQRKAQATYDFYAAQKASAEKELAAGKLKVDREVQGDNPDTTGENEVETSYTAMDTDYTVEDYEALTDLQGAQGDAADALKAAYDARVAATDDVEANQRDTQKYLEQLVALREYEQGVADAAAPDDAEEDTAAQKTADGNLDTAEAQLASFNALQALGDANPVKALVNSLLEANGTDGDDDGQALVEAIDATYQTANDAMTAVEGLGGADGKVAQNTGAIAQETEDRVAADDALGMRIDTNWDEAIAVNQMDIDDLEAEDVRLEGRIDTNWDAIAVNQMDIDVNEMAIAGNTTAIGNNTTSITSNSTMIGENASAISRHSGMITDNRNRIGELSDDLDIVRSGVAASMALAGMPAINGRGIAIGVGSFDGESAFAVGFQIQGEMASFQIGVTSSGGETGASAGVGFQF